MFIHPIEKAYLRYNQYADEYNDAYITPLDDVVAVIYQIKRSIYYDAPWTAMLNTNFTRYGNVSELYPLATTVQVTGALFFHDVTVADSLIDLNHYEETSGHHISVEYVFNNKRYRKTFSNCIFGCNIGEDYRGILTQYPQLPQEVQPLPQHIAFLMTCPLHLGMSGAPPDVSKLSTYLITEQI